MEVLEPEEIVDGRFRIVERIGAGGMGVVFRAIDERVGTMVALKVLEGRTPHEIERARREAEVLARLSHDAIVRHIADGVLAGGSLYLAMEWIDGVTVGDHINDTGFTLRESFATVRRVAEALATAHRADVVHRDLKPSNILLERDDPARAKLIDFGIARLRDSVQALTRTGAAVGTPGYMSPEQARGERELTPAADVFGLGCVLYECLTAKPAFSGTAAVAVMAKILLAEPTPLVAGCPEASRPVIALLERMLAKDTRRRLPDCGAVVMQIDALGELPDGPRRTSRRLVVDATQIARPAGVVHCMIAASRGNPDDVEAPPTPRECHLLAQAVEQWHGRLEVLATGGVVAHVTGEPKEASQRSAMIALALRRLLPGWAIAISSACDELDAAADQGTALLTQAAMAAIFGELPADAISLDPTTAEFLGPEFEVTQELGRATLVGRK